MSQKATKMKRSGCITVAIVSVGYNVENLSI